MKMKRKKRDDTKLICDVGELSGLFNDSSSLEIFLSKVVDLIAEHMHSEVCSIYLYQDHAKKLVLIAGMNGLFFISLNF